MSTNQKVLATISKLLAVQEGRGATEAEAAIAAEHVQRLLQEHNLTLSQVEQAGGSTDEGARREKVTTEYKAPGKWAVRLMESLADNNFCLHRVSKIFVPASVSKWSGGRSKKWDSVAQEWVHGHHEERHVLIGRTLNVRVTQDTYDYLCSAIVRAGTEAGYVARGNDRREANWFRDGCAERLCDRLAEKRREAEAASQSPAAQGNGTHRELVLSDVYGTEADLNNDALNGFPAGTTAAKRRESAEREANRKAKEQELIAEGVEATEAFYQSYGYSPELARTYAANWRRGSGRGGGRGRSRSWTQGSDDRYRKVNSGAYKAGREAGAKIGLDSQVGGGSRKRIGRS